MNVPNEQSAAGNNAKNKRFPLGERGLGREGVREREGYYSSPGNETGYALTPLQPGR